MNKKEIILGLIAAVILAVMFSPFASPWPDGLEKVAEDKGFLEQGEGEPVFVSPIPDYSWPGLTSERAATQAAGFAGTLLVFFCGFALAAIVKQKDNAAV